MGSINNCKPTKDTYKVCIPYKSGSIGACSPTETQQLNETNTKIGYVYGGTSSPKVSDSSFFADVPTQLLRWFVDKNGNKKLQQCYHIFKTNSYDYEVIWKDIEIVYEK